MKVDIEILELLSKVKGMTPDAWISMLGQMSDGQAERLAASYISDEFDEKAEKIRERLRPYTGGIAFGAIHSYKRSCLLEDREVASSANYDIELPYKERQRMKCNLRKICSKMQSKDEKKRSEGNLEFMRVYASMSEAEKILLFKECMMIIGNSKQIDEMANKVMNRDEMGRVTTCRITVSDDVELRNTLGVADNRNMFVIVEKEERQYAVKLSPVATVIYVMNLICRHKDINDSCAIVDMYDNREVFEKVYLKVMNDKSKSEVENRVRTVLEEKRLKEYYNEIEEKMTELLRNLGEDPSPFLINSVTPLVVKQDKIGLPTELEKMEIRVADEKKMDFLGNEKTYITDM